MWWGEDHAAPCGWLGTGGDRGKSLPRDRERETQQPLKPAASASRSLRGRDGGQSYSPASYSPLTPQSPSGNTPHGAQEAPSSVWLQPGPPGAPLPLAAAPAGPRVAACRDRWAEVTPESKSPGPVRVPASLRSWGGRGTRLPSCVCDSAAARGSPGDPRSVAASRGRRSAWRQPFRGRGLCLWAPAPCRAWGPCPVLLPQVPLASLSLSREETAQPILIRSLWKPPGAPPPHRGNTFGLNHARMCSRRWGWGVAPPQQLGRSSQPRQEANSL